MHLIPRETHPRAQWLLEQAGIHPLLAKLYAARDITSPEEVDVSLQLLLPPDTLKGAQEAAVLLANTLASQHKICIVADYDCDGATACSVGLRGLAMLGFAPEQLTYIVPDRVVDGYGLTASIAERVKATGANLLVTVDNGIASMAGVEHAHRLGMQVLVTDHHLPAFVDNQVQLPIADVIVNPNQPGCTFPSKAMAGVGVMFYVLLALRAELRSRGLFDFKNQPRLDRLLDLVALGTIADVVKLDANNRRLVWQGLERIRKGQMHPGIAALFKVAVRSPTQANTFDMGFGLGPRLNAAGRLADMTIGIECLTTDDPERATQLAQMLDKINRERKTMETSMIERSLILLNRHLTLDEQVASPSLLPAAISIYDPEFHEGVVGILASRIKDRFYRPSFVFATSLAPGQETILKGSGRSIAGFHLRDALDLIEKHHPHLLVRFGGHAMAAGCTIRLENFDAFCTAFAQTAQAMLDETILAHKLPTDGALPAAYCTPQTARMLQSGVWGSGFAAPLFSEPLEVISQRVVGEKHMALKLRYNKRIIDAIWFGRNTPVPNHPTLAYRLDVDEWQGNERVRFVIEGINEP